MNEILLTHGYYLEAGDAPRSWRLRRLMEDRGVGYLTINNLRSIEISNPVSDEQLITIGGRRKLFIETTEGGTAGFYDDVDVPMIEWTDPALIGAWVDRHVCSLVEKSLLLTADQ